MIALKRIRTDQAIVAKYRGDLKKGKDKELIIAKKAFLIDPEKKIKFLDSFWTAAKPQLKKESNGKCAYCEANTAIVAHGDVEHYRPKSVYWWLAYTYDNYLYACQICNQTYKSDNFPIGASVFPEPKITPDLSDAAIENLLGNISPDPFEITLNYNLQKYLDEHKAEKAHLINPYFENPTKYFVYEADDFTEEVKIIPKKPLYAKQVKAAEDFYGINRPELKNARYAVYSLFRVLKMSLKTIISAPSTEILIKEIKKQIEAMIADKYLFAGMNRYFDSKL